MEAPPRDWTGRPSNLSIKYKELTLTDEKLKAAQGTLADFAPKIMQVTNDVLFGDIWERPDLNKRDRSLITCTASNRAMEIFEGQV